MPISSIQIKLLLILILAASLSPLSAALEETNPCASDALTVGFYAYFAPVSYSADEDPESEDFNTQLGYEADLLTALEAMEGAGLSFIRRAIPLWDDIWLQSATAEYDIIGGGISILDSRRRNAMDEEAVTFTSGHIGFRQSLLARAEDAELLNSYNNLSSNLRIGALAGTTGEFRLLQLTGLADADGVLAASTRIETPGGTMIADGSADYVITAAGASLNLAGRRQLYPPAETMPQVIYLGDETGESELLEALGASEIDAIARGHAGNLAATQASAGAFVVAALDDKVEHGGFTLDLDDMELAACLDEKINWLTDDQQFGYAEWVSDPTVFMQRAEIWNEREEQSD